LKTNVPSLYGKRCWGNSGSGIALRAIIRPVQWG
jgi:hypothetical protein